MPPRRSKSPVRRSKSAAKPSKAHVKKAGKPSKAHVTRAGKAERSNLRNLWEFMYPHTIIGTVLSIVVNSELALRDHSKSFADDDCPRGAWAALGTALLSALCMNVYIVGINQCFDVEIDRLNKPYLPLASGAWSMRTGWSLVAATAVASLLLASFAPASSTRLLQSVALSGVLGTAYSVDLPFLRWKGYPLLASSCIFTVRGFVVQIGFYEHMVQSMKLCDGRDVICKQWYESEVLCLSIVFVTMLSFAIAFCKDVPDIAGDKKGGIRTLPVRLGAVRVLSIVHFILLASYAVAVGRSHRSSHGTVAHLALAAVTLYRARHVDVKSVKSIRSYYMHVWLCFYVEYLVLLFLLRPGDVTFGNASPLETSVPVTIVLPLVVAAIAYARKWLTPIGSVAGFAIGTVVVRSGIAGSLQLFVFFVGASLISKYRRRVEQRRRCLRDDHESDEAKTGRDVWQALATGGLPAILSTGCMPFFQGETWRPAFLAYLACCCGDTFASELGSLAAQSPVALYFCKERRHICVRSVKRGTDGGVTFAGVVASCIGGALVGVCDVFGQADPFGNVLPVLSLPAAIRSAFLGAVLGFTGSTLDSFLGSCMQSEFAISGPGVGAKRHKWKQLNTLVNFLSSTMNIFVGTLLWARPVEVFPLLLFLMALQLLLLAPGVVPGITPWHTRKGLHIITSALVLALDARASIAGDAFESRARLVVQVVGGMTLIALVAARDVFRRFDMTGTIHSARTSSAGIPLYTGAVVAAATFAKPLGLSLSLLCGPMFFGDPLAAIVGRAAPARCNVRFARFNGKSVCGSLALFSFCVIWFSASAYHQHAMFLAAALTAVEFVSGDYDNVTLVALSGALLWQLPRSD